MHHTGGRGRVERHPVDLCCWHEHLQFDGSGGQLEQQQYGCGHGECDDGCGDSGIGGYGNDDLYGHGHWRMSEWHGHKNGNGKPAECINHQPDDLRTEQLFVQRAITHDIGYLYSHTHQCSRL